MSYSLKKNFTQIPNELFQMGLLNARAITVYAYLKFRAYNGNGEITFPSQKRIMSDLKIKSDNTLRKDLKELEEAGFLLIKRGSNFTGNSLYRLKIPEKFEDEIS